MKLRTQSSDRNHSRPAAWFNEPGTSSPLIPVLSLSGVWELFLLRATFQAVHKSVMNANKNTVLDLVSECDIIVI